MSRPPRTGRGLNWHSRIEPYLPHHLSGFVLLAWRYLPNRDDPMLVIDDDED